MIVIDASALIKVLVEKGPSADTVRKRLAGEALAAPAHLDVEILSVLRGLTLSGKLAVDRAEVAIGLLEVMPLERVPARSTLAEGGSCAATTVPTTPCTSRSRRRSPAR